MTGEIIACVTVLLCILAVTGGVLAGMAMTYSYSRLREEEKRLDRIPARRDGTPGPLR